MHVDLVADVAADDDRDALALRHGGTADPAHRSAALDAHGDDGDGRWLRGRRRRRLRAPWRTAGERAACSSWRSSWWFRCRRRHPAGGRRTARRRPQRQPRRRGGGSWGHRCTGSALEGRGESRRGADHGATSCRPHERRARLDLRAHGAGVELAQLVGFVGAQLRSSSARPFRIREDRWDLGQDHEPVGAARAYRAPGKRDLVHTASTPTSRPPAPRPGCRRRRRRRRQRRSRAAPRPRPSSTTQRGIGDGTTRRRPRPASARSASRVRARGRSPPARRRTGRSASSGRSKAGSSAPRGRGSGCRRRPGRERGAQFRGDQRADLRLRLRNREPQRQRRCLLCRALLAQQLVADLRPVPCVITSARLVEQRSAARDRAAQVRAAARPPFRARRDA